MDMKCPVCAPARLVEEDLLSHILAEHPTERNLAGLIIGVGTFALAGRPRQLLRLYGVVLIAALLLAQPPLPYRPA